LWVRLPSVMPSEGTEKQKDSLICGEKNGKKREGARTGEKITWGVIHEKNIVNAKIDGWNGNRWKARKGEVVWW